jgi:hypothetical protein
MNSETAPRILYHCPDYADEPTGGVLCIYRHVEALRRRGFPAWVLHRKSGLRARWFASAAPVLSREDGEGPRAGDFLVLPEGERRLMIENAGRPWTTSVFAQSWSYIFGSLEPGERWQDWGIESALAVSRHVQRYLRRGMGLASTLVRPSLDLDLFRPGRKRMQIACMPRKHPDDLRQIEAILRLRHPRFRSVPFVPVDGLPHHRVAEILAESAVFLATGYPEGFALPPLEAMACGCLVAGFSGGGGREYMRHRKNCWIAPDGDVLTAAAHLAAALAAAEKGEDAPIRAEARRTAEEFSPATEEEALARYWGSRLAKTPKTASHPGPLKRLILLSVHYLHPELLTDQIERFRRCAAPLAEMGYALHFHPIVHRFCREDVGHTVAGLCHGRDIFRVRGIDLRGRQTIPKGGQSHGHSLSAALQRLWKEKAIDFDDLVGVVDHDAHPLDTRLLARLAGVLEGSPDLAGVGLPQWQRGHCFLHPSLFLTRVRTVEEMGPSTAFEVRLPRTPEDESWSDTAEAFTLWCEERGRPILPLRVCSTAYPWTKWDSDMAPGNGTELTGWHGESVRVGHLMRYGLEEDAPLVSHLWAGPLGPYKWMDFSAHAWDDVLAEYLAEPLAGA